MKIYLRAKRIYINHKKPTPITVRHAATVNESAPALMASLPKMGAIPRNMGVKKAAMTPFALAFGRMNPELRRLFVRYSATIKMQTKCYFTAYLVSGIQ